MEMTCLVISNRRIENALYFACPEDLQVYLGQGETHIKTLIFAFWSWKVPDHILESYKVYGMHTGPLLEGKGKGGSPLDNLKALGVKWTTLCAFEMTSEIDGGRVVLAVPFNIEAEKDILIQQIDDSLPEIEAYLTVEQPEIPERFERIK
jgi:hypothetical protein